MAAGDLTVFEEFRAEISNEHDLDADVYKMALLTAAVTPTAADATPRLGDYTEVTVGGNYTPAGGTDITATYTEAGGTATFDGADVTWTQDPGNPTNARWALIYNDTLAGKNAVCFIDLGTTIDMTAGDLTVSLNASGVFTLA